ncbi:MAG: hypothetical protein O7I42_12485 [Alphaproteobacteria bacterium]|nr:hypothetical protein [Alphaproteobacteria bacterium]
MFGFSIGKLAVLAAIIAAVWYGFKLYHRLEAKRAAEQLGRRDSKDTGEAMVECKACGVYNPASGAKNCGRADCPY